MSRMARVNFEGNEYLDDEAGEMDILAYMLNILRRNARTAKSRMYGIVSIQKGVTSGLGSRPVIWKA